METAAPEHRLPNFLVIGAMKCGTQSMYRYLRQHPEVFMHPTRDLRFFTEEHNWNRGVDWYRSQFAGAGRASVVGEAPNGYTRHPIYGGVPERIHGLLPDVRMVYVIRSPLKRIESHYRHRIVTGFEWRGAEDAIREDPSYVAISRYGSQLEQYLRFFPLEQILILSLERLIAEPDAMLGRLCRFLGIAETPGIPYPRENITRERSSAPLLLRRFSRFSSLRPHVQRASRRLHHTRFGGSTAADEVPFDLGRDTRERLDDVFREDLALLSSIAGESFEDLDRELSARAA